MNLVVYYKGNFGITMLNVLRDTPTWILSALSLSSNKQEEKEREGEMEHQTRKNKSKNEERKSEGKHEKIS